MTIGLNPSTANDIADDPTIRVLVKSLDILGFGGLKMCNLYAFISSDPKKLSECPDPVKYNDEWLKVAAHNSQTIIFCWGNFTQATYRIDKIKNLFPDGKCFGKNKNGSPLHPMSLMYKGVKSHELKLEKF